MTSRSKVFWLIFGTVLMPAVATLTVGILILSLQRWGGDIVLGVLTICFAVFTFVGSITTALVVRNQNRLLRLEREFIANVSHELRTPISSIKLMLETLKMGRVSSQEQQDQMMDLMNRELERLHLLTERLIDFKSLALGASRQDRQPTSIEPLVEDVIEVNRERMNDPEQLALVIEPALPRVSIDHWSFEEALTNLVKNAIVHGADGPIIVTVRAEGLGLAISVRDHGPGIAKRERKRVFKRFYRSPRALADAKPGLGIGLAIARAFAHTHQGHIKLDSHEGQGTTFTLWLPASGSLD